MLIIMFFFHLLSLNENLKQQVVVSGKSKTKSDTFFCGLGHFAPLIYCFAEELFVCFFFS